MKYGLLEVLSALRLFSGANYAAFKAPAALAASYALTMPTALPGSTQGLQIDAAGNLGYFTPNSGTVTSVALSAPTSIFTVGGSPVTASGTLALTLANQAANTVFAAPAGGGAPVFRGLAVTDFATLPRLDQWAAPTAAINLNNQQITNLADPTANQHAATKAYVDARVQGLRVKDPCRYITVANIPSLTTATAATIQAALDPVGGAAPTLATNDRILVPSQTTKSENGLYYWNGTNLVRTPDADTSAKVTPDIFTFVEQGDTYADTGWTLTNDQTITLGTTALNFAQFSAAGQINDGAGLFKTGNTVNIGTASNTRIVVNADNIDLATTGVVSNSYFRCTVDPYGRVTAGTNPTTLAGFGITDAQPLDAELSAISALTTNGFLAKTGASTAATRAIAGTTGRVTVGNGDGVTGNPTIDLATTGVTPGTFNRFTVDAYGRITAASSVAVSGIYRLQFTSTNLTSGILTLNHGLGSQYCVVKIFDNSNQEIIPDNVTANSTTATSVDLTSFGSIVGNWQAVVLG